MRITTQNVKLKDNSLKERLKAQVRISELFESMGIDIVRKGKWDHVQRHDSWVINNEKNVTYWNSRNLVHADLYTSYIWAVEEFQNRTIDFPTAFQEIKSFVKEGRIKQSEAQSYSTRAKIPFKQEYDALRYGRDNEFYEENREAKAAYRYLVGERCISPRVFEHFKETGMLEQQKCKVKRENKKTGEFFRNPAVAFIAWDDRGQKVGTCQREIANISGSYKGDYDDCDYTYGWYYDLDVDPSQIDNQITNHCYIEPNGSKTLIAFESVIEIMSYISLLEKAGKDPRDYAYVGTSGTNKTKCVENLCQRYGYQEVIIAFNNDLQSELQGKQNAGKHGAQVLQERLDTLGISSQIMLPAYTNDWNDALKLVVKGAQQNQELINGTLIGQGEFLDPQDALNYCDELPGREQLESREVWVGPIPSAYQIDDVKKENTEHLFCDR